MSDDPIDRDQRPEAVARRTQATVQRIEDQFERYHARFDVQMDRLDAKLEAGMNRFETRLDAVSTGLDRLLLMLMLASAVIAVILAKGFDWR